MWTLVSSLLEQMILIRYIGRHLVQKNTWLFLCFPGVSKFFSKLIFPWNELAQHCLVSYIQVYLLCQRGPFDLFCPTTEALWLSLCTHLSGILMILLLKSSKWMVGLKNHHCLSVHLLSIFSACVSSVYQGVLSFRMMSVLWSSTWQSSTCICDRELLYWSIMAVTFLAHDVRSELSWISLLNTPMSILLRFFH